MERPFVVQGLNPATGRFMQVTLLSATAGDAKNQAEEAGLKVVVVVSPVLDAPSEPAEPPSPADGPLVLLVDDSPEVLSVLSRLLRSEGYRVVAVPGAPEALAALESLQPALVIVDFLMPGMNGLTLLGEIRSINRLRTASILVFSAADVRHPALQAGADAFVHKESMDWAVLKREVLRLVGPGVPATPPAPVAPLPPARARDTG